MSDLTHLTIAEAADLLARREIAAVELTEAHLRRIDAHDTHLNSFITVTSDHALTQARAADAELTRGVRRGPLHGIPLALKDLYDTAGIRTTAGSTFFADRIPDTDARAVTLLYQAGAVLLGKLNMHEWALGVTNINPHYGPSRNPWDPSRITGGSSGGAAAALAAGLCMGALGSDTGGSIRIPSSLCGIVGLKPTFGRVSLQGVIPLSWNLDHAGPMARTVTDAALLLQAIAGYDPDDPVSVALPVDNLLATLDAGVTGWRIALATDAHFGEADPEVISAVRRAATVFEELGARVEAVDLSQGREAAQMNALMTTSDAAAFHRDRLRDHPHRFGADVLARMERGAQFTSTGVYPGASLSERMAPTPGTPLRAVRSVADACHADHCTGYRRAGCNRGGASTDPLHRAVQSCRSPGALSAVRSERRRIADRVADRCRALERSAGAARRQGIRERNAMASPDSARMVRHDVRQRPTAVLPRLRSLGAPILEWRSLPPQRAQRRLSAPLQPTPDNR
jgi:aspartyl-tRNA(Asn)/glutamyl-tRNA(Gln) amidotransferase subunit A